jgi:hypothetical protein
MGREALGLPPLRQYWQEINRRDRAAKALGRGQSVKRATESGVSAAALLILGRTVPAAGSVAILSRRWNAGSVSRNGSTGRTDGDTPAYSGRSPA